MRYDSWKHIDSLASRWTNLFVFVVLLDVIFIVGVLVVDGFVAVMGSKSPSQARPEHILGNILVWYTSYCDVTK